MELLEESAHPVPCLFSRGMQRECDVEVLHKKMNVQKQEKGRGGWGGSAVYVMRAGYEFLATHGK